MSELKTTQNSSPKHIVKEYKMGWNEYSKVPQNPQNPQKTITSYICFDSCAKDDLVRCKSVDEVIELIELNLNRFKRLCKENLDMYIINLLRNHNYSQKLFDFLEPLYKFKKSIKIDWDILDNNGKYLTEGEKIIIGKRFLDTFKHPIVTFKKRDNVWYKNQRKYKNIIATLREDFLYQSSETLYGFLHEGLPVKNNNINNKVAGRDLREDLICRKYEFLKYKLIKQARKDKKIIRN